MTGPGRRWRRGLVVGGAVWCCLAGGVPGGDPGPAGADGAGRTGVATPVCPPDSVPVARVCLDRFEASLWRTTDAGLIVKIRQGTVTEDDLLAAGAVPKGLAAGDLEPGCQKSGAGCLDVYAVSIRDVFPAQFVTWFQAAAAARNAWKRLPTNQEWQVAALGTPDAAPCNVDFGAVGPTGANDDLPCRSDLGAVDMVGNVWEYVAEWGAASPFTCSTPALFGGDFNCLHPDTYTATPGAVIRGGSAVNAGQAGAHAVGTIPLDTGAALVGFRAIR